MAVNSNPVSSLNMGLTGIAIDVAERCLPFIANGLSGVTIEDPQDAFEALHQENVHRHSQSMDASMDWVATDAASCVPIDISTTAKVNPFLDSPVSKPVNPFLDAAVVKPVNPFSQPAVVSLPVDMDIDEWSNIYDHTNAKCRQARQRKNKNKNRKAKSGKGTTDNNNNKGSAPGFLGHHKVTKAPTETRRDGNHNNNNKSRRRSNGNKKNRSQHQ